MSVSIRGNGVDCWRTAAAISRLRLCHVLTYAQIPSIGSDKRLHSRTAPKAHASHLFYNQTGENMNPEAKAASLVAIAIAFAIFLCGCATRHAPDFKGHWIAVNRFAETTEAIPLHRAYVFYPSPTDKTLKAMLTRWAQDSEMTLSYQHRSDFTLHEPVAQVRTENIQEAVAALTRIYGEQQVLVEANHSKIIVRAADATSDKQSE